MENDAHDEDGELRPCDHIVGWVHCHRFGRRLALPPPRPRLVRSSEVDDVVSAYRTELAHEGASYQRTFAMSDELVFSLAAYHFRFCPTCGERLFPDEICSRNRR